LKTIANAKNELTLLDVLGHHPHYWRELSKCPTPEIVPITEATWNHHYV
jgi:hypothetical protein